MLRRFLPAAAALLLMGVVASVAYLLLPAVGSVSGRALDRSVTRTARGITSSDSRCLKRRKGLWECSVGDTAGSGSASYRVTMRGRRCWRALKVVPETDGRPLRKAMTGCVGLRDQGRVMERLFPDHYP